MHLLFRIQQSWSFFLFSFMKPSYKVLEGEVIVIATRQSSSIVKWRCYLESEGTESEANKNSTVIKWQGSWKENAREDERESILFLGWIFALYLCCSPPLNLTKHSGNILSNKFKPPFPSSLHLCHSCYSVCEHATKDPVTWKRSEKRIWRGGCNPIRLKDTIDRYDCHESRKKRHSSSPLANFI